MALRDDHQPAAPPGRARRGRLAADTPHTRRRPTLLTTTLSRLSRLARLDLRIFDEVRDDPNATIPALVVAVASVLLLGLGGWLWWLLSGLGDTGSVFLKSVVLGCAFALGLWLVWLLVAYAVLQRVTAVTVPADRLLRCAGFAATPAALGVFMVIPAVSFGVGLLAIGAWLLLTQVAIERTSGIGGATAMLANAAGFAVWALGMSLLSTGSNQFGVGPFLAESIWEALTGFDAGRDFITG